MNPIQLLLSLRAAMPSGQRHLLLGAAIVAVVLLSFYVHLLHESIALGDQLRARQRIAANMGTMKSALQQTRIGAVEIRNTADGANSRTR